MIDGLADIRTHRERRSVALAMMTLWMFFYADHLDALSNTFAFIVRDFVRRC